MKRIVAVSMIVAMLFGCAEFQQATKAIEAKLGVDLTTEQKATLEGGAAGALLGAVAGRIIGDDAEATIACTAAGAVIGGLAANWYIRRVEARSEGLKGKENNLDARIQYARKVNSDVTQYNTNLKKQLEKTKIKIKDLRMKRDSKKITQSALEKERQVLSKQVAIAEDNKTLLTAQLDELKKFRDGHNAQSGQLDEQIATLEKRLEEVKRNTYELASLNL
jgi:uncharacterized protein YcfJ